MTSQPRLHYDIKVSAKNFSGPFGFGPNIFEQGNILAALLSSSWASLLGIRKVFLKKPIFSISILSGHKKSLQLWSKNTKFRNRVGPLFNAGQKYV